MRKPVIVIFSIVGLVFGAAVGLLATSISGFTPALQQTNDDKTWPLIDIQEQVPISVTLSFGEDGTQPVVVPMILNYKFSANLAGRFLFEDIDVPPRATFADLVNINSLKAIKYDNSGIGYTATFPENVEVQHASYANFDDGFAIKGTITNLDPTLTIKDADIVVTAYDTEGIFLGSNTNWMTVASDDPDDLIHPGKSSSFMVSFDEDEAKLNDVGFYSLFVTVVFSEAPQRRQ